MRTGTTAFNRRTTRQKGPKQMTRHKPMARAAAAVLALCLFTGAPLLQGCGATTPGQVIEQQGARTVQGSMLALGLAYRTATETRAHGGMTAKKFAQVFAGLDAARDLILQAEVASGVSQQQLLGEAAQKMAVQ